MSFLEKITPPTAKIRNIESPQSLPSGPPTGGGENPFGFQLPKTSTDGYLEGLGKSSPGFGFQINASSVPEGDSGGLGGTQGGSGGNDSIPGSQNLNPTGGTGAGASSVIDVESSQVTEETEVTEKTKETEEPENTDEQFPETQEEAFQAYLEDFKTSSLFSMIRKFKGLLSKKGEVLSSEENNDEGSFKVTDEEVIETLKESLKKSLTKGDQLDQVGKTSPENLISIVERLTKIPETFDLAESLVTRLEGEGLTSSIIESSSSGTAFSPINSIIDLIGKFDIKDLSQATLSSRETIALQKRLLNQVEKSIKELRDDSESNDLDDEDVPFLFSKLSSLKKALKFEEELSEIKNHEDLIRKLTLYFNKFAKKSVTLNRKKHATLNELANLAKILAKVENKLSEGELSEKNKKFLQDLKKRLDLYIYDSVEKEFQGSTDLTSLKKMVTTLQNLHNDGDFFFPSSLKYKTGFREKNIQNLEKILAKNLSSQAKDLFESNSLSEIVSLVDQLEKSQETKDLARTLKRGTGSKTLADLIFEDTTKSLEEASGESNKNNLFRNFQEKESLLKKAISYLESGENPKSLDSLLDTLWTINVLRSISIEKLGLSEEQLDYQLKRIKEKISEESDDEKKIQLRYTLFELESKKEPTAGQYVKYLENLEEIVRSLAGNTDSSKINSLLGDRYVVKFLALREKLSKDSEKNSEEIKELDQKAVKFVRSWIEGLDSSELLSNFHYFGELLNRMGDFDGKKELMSDFLSLGIQELEGKNAQDEEKIGKYELENASKGFFKIYSGLRKKLSKNLEEGSQEIQELDQKAKRFTKSCLKQLNNIFEDQSSDVEASEQSKLKAVGDAFISSFFNITEEEGNLPYSTELELLDYLLLSQIEIIDQKKKEGAYKRSYNQALIYFLEYPVLDLYIDLKINPGEELKKARFELLKDYSDLKKELSKDLEKNSEEIQELESETREFLESWIGKLKNRTYQSTEFTGVLIGDVYENVNKLLSSLDSNILDSEKGKELANKLLSDQIEAIRERILRSSMTPEKTVYRDILVTFLETLSLRNPDDLKIEQELEEARFAFLEHLLNSKKELLDDNETERDSLGNKLKSHIHFWLEHSPPKNNGYKEKLAKVIQEAEFYDQKEKLPLLAKLYSVSTKMEPPPDTRKDPPPPLNDFQAKILRINELLKESSPQNNQKIRSLIEELIPGALNLSKGTILSTPNLSPKQKEELADIIKKLPVKGGECEDEGCGGCGSSEGGIFTNAEKNLLLRKLGQKTDQKKTTSKKTSKPNSPEGKEEKEEEKGLGIGPLLVLGALGAGGLGYYFYSQKNNNNGGLTNTDTESTEESTAEENQKVAQN